MDILRIPFGPGRCGIMVDIKEERICWTYARRTIEVRRDRKQSISKLYVERRPWLGGNGVEMAFPSESTGLDLVPYERCLRFRESVVLPGNRRVYVAEEDKVRARDVAAVVEVRDQGRVVREMLGLDRFGGDGLDGLRLPL